MATKTIGSTGDYATLADWEVYLQGLGTITGTETGELQNQEHAANSFSGVAVSGAGIIVLKCVAGASFVDNMNPATDALVYDATKGARVVTTTADWCIEVATGKWRVEGLMCSNSAAWGGGIKLVSDGKDQHAKNCIVLLSGTNGSHAYLMWGGATNLGENLLAYATNSGSSKSGFLSYWAATIWKNCYAIRTAGTGGNGFEAPTAGTTVEFINCYSAGHATDVTGSATISGTNNVTSLASSGFPATNLGTSKALADQVVNATNDFRIKAGAYLIDNGHSSGASIDIYGRTRAGTKDVGPDEYPSATSKLLLQLVQQGTYL